MIGVHVAWSALVLFAQVGGETHLGASDARLVEARAALARGDLDKARGLCRESVEKHADAEDRVFEANMLLGAVELKAKRYSPAFRAYHAASLSASLDSGARAAALKGRLRAAAEGKLKPDATQTQEVKTQDAEVDKLRKRRGFNDKARTEARATLARARAVYKLDKDRVRAELADAVGALVLVRGGKVEDGMREAKAFAEKQRPRAVRLVALEALRAGAELGNDLELALDSAFEASALLADRLPEAERRYARAAGVDVLCVRYDEAHGKAACARRERRITGRFTFTDFSRAKAKSSLSEDDLARVHAQLLPALEECLLTAAKRAPDVFLGTDIEVGWVVQPSGRASDLEISPRRVRSDVGDCLDERLGWARYPIYSSDERTTVRIPFHLSN